MHVQHIPQYLNVPEKCSLGNLEFPADIFSDNIQPCSQSYAESENAFQAQG